MSKDQPCRYCGAPVNDLLNVCFACGADQGEALDENLVFKKVNKE